MENNVPHNFERPIEQIEYCFFETLDSTHKFALKQNWYGRLNERNLITIFAAEQTDGVGSHNRIWSSSGEDFHVSFVFLLDKTLPFSQIAAFTACQFLNRLTEKQYKFQLKWPNDICVQGCKVGGCMSHIRNEGEYFWATVGVGINFNLSEELAETIDQPVISLKKLLSNSEDYPTSELFKYIQEFSKVFVQNLHWYHRSGLESFFHDAEPLWLYRDEKVRIYDEDKKQWLHGTLEAINLNGGLVLKNKKNETSVVLNGTQLRREADK